MKGVFGGRRMTELIFAAKRTPSGSLSGRLIGRGCGLVKGQHLRSQVSFSLLPLFLG